MCSRFKANGFLVAQCDKDILGSGLIFNEGLYLNTFNSKKGFKCTRWRKIMKLKQAAFEKECLLPSYKNLFT